MSSTVNQLGGKILFNSPNFSRFSILFSFHPFSGFLVFLPFRFFYTAFYDILSFVFRLFRPDPRLMVTDPLGKFGSAGIESAGIESAGMTAIAVGVHLLVRLYCGVFTLVKVVVY